jgi:hypothetical protein
MQNCANFSQPFHPLFYSSVYLQIIMFSLKKVSGLNIQLYAFHIHVEVLGLCDDSFGSETATTSDVV